MQTAAAARVALFSLATLAAGAVAQAPQPQAFTEVAGIGIGAGLQIEDGELLGFGTDYKATFAGARLVYTPMLGKAAPHDLPLAMAVTHVGRGELAPVGAATTVQHELRVDFVRPQVREQLDIRPEGLKQSFVFEQLPPGAGDLVVRTRLQTELRPEHLRSDGALRFLRPGSGGIEIGQVVGIDHDGRRATGWLQTDGETLDFVLPAAFVATATLPLCVDPLLTSIVVTAATGEDREPDACAQQAPFNTYLVVWARGTSATNNDVRAQRVSSGGALLGGLITLESSATSAVSIRVIDSPHSGRWFVCWQQAGDIVGRFVDSQAVAGATVNVATGTNQQTAPALAGGNFGGLPHLVCVWRDSTANAIKGCTIDIQTETAGAEVTLATGTSLVNVSQPAISPDNPVRRALVTYVSTSTLLGTASVRGIVIDDNTAAITSTFPIAGSTSTDATDPACAGAGNRWVVAFATSALLGNGLACLPVELQGTQPVVGASRAINGANGTAHDPSVAWFGDSAFIAYSSTNGTANDVAVLSVDPFSCANCEGTLTIDVGGNDVDVAITSRFGNLPSVNQGAVAYVPLTSGTGDLTLRLLSAADGTTTDLGGGCTNGLLLAPCAHAGNANFGVQLRNGPPNELTFAIYSTGSFGASGFPCGTCSVVPDTTIGVIQTAGVSSAFGAASSPLPLPGGAGVIGANVYSQFFFFGGNCLSMFRLTDAIRFTIE